MPPIVSHMPRICQIGRNCIFVGETGDVTGAGRRRDACLRLSRANSRNALKLDIDVQNSLAEIHTTQDSIFVQKINPRINAHKEYIFHPVRHDISDRAFQYNMPDLESLYHNLNAASHNSTQNRIQENHQERTTYNGLAKSDALVQLTRFAALVHAYGNCGLIVEML